MTCTEQGPVVEEPIQFEKYTQCVAEVTCKGLRRVLKTAVKVRKLRWHDEGTEVIRGGQSVIFYETVRRGRSCKLSVQWIGSCTVTEVDKVNVT